MVNILHSLGPLVLYSMPQHSTVLCRQNPGLCKYNTLVKALMYDFRQSRDVVNNPFGTHTVVTP